MTTTAPKELSKLHDGYLTGLTSTDRALRLHCRAITGDAVVISIADVVDLFATNFRMKSTILSILTMSSIREVPRELIEGLAQSAEPRFVDPYLTRAEAREKSEGARYLVLQSSYGCDLVAVFEGQLSTQIREGDATSEVVT